MNKNTTPPALAEYISPLLFDCISNNREIQLAVWLSDNVLCSIKVVALRQTWLVPGWVTICEWVNQPTQPFILTGSTVDKLSTKMPVGVKAGWSPLSGGR